MDMASGMSGALEFTFYVFNEFTRVWSFDDKAFVSSMSSAVTFFSSSPILLAM